MRSSYVIIGNGIAGVTAAEILRAEDAECMLTIVADDPFPVYYRPALKDFLGGHLTEEKLWARPSTFYQEQDIRFLPARVTQLNTQQHALRLHNGKTLQYDRLLLAHGARPRALACAGLNLNGVFTLRTVSDYQRILQRLEHVQNVVVCGSGTLALESAETLVQRGYAVTHLLRGQLIWSEVLDAVASDMVLQEERRAGIEVCTGEEVAEIIGQDGEVCGVRTTRGRQLPCELVLIAVGIEPVLDFLRGSDVACGKGVKVDNAMRTNAPDVYAAGDVIETTELLSGRTRVMGQWYPAIQQARSAALNMAGVSSAASQEANASFYNATFLRGLNFVSLGLTTRPPVPGFYEIVADPQPRSYRKIILHNGIAVGALLLGEREQALAIKRAIDHRVNLAPIARQLFSPDFELDAWLTRQGIPAPLLAPTRESTSEIHTADAEVQADITRIIPSDVLRELPDTPALVLLGSDGISHTFLLTEGQRYQIGRDTQNAIVLTDSSTSRHHAEITSTPMGFSIRDLSSRYGVFLNRKRVQDVALLQHGDRVAIGNMLLYFSWPQESTKSASSKLRSVSASRSPAGQKPIVVGLEHRGAVVPLGEAHLKFEIDMCIGCNRCMEACPLPSSNSVTIAALNHANVTEIISPTLARFTHECIMCGSCVPVCPVDNHRDLLMFALKQRIGLSWKSQPNMVGVNQMVPAGWSLAQLMQHLREQRVLSNPEQVPDTYLLHMIAASRALILKPEEVLLREGEYGRDLYLILEGQLALTTNDRENNELLLARLKRGEYVGEDGMLTGQPYKVSVRAQAPTLIFQVPEQVMQRLMELVAGVREHFERCVQATSLQTILTRLELFEGVMDADLQELIRRSPVRQYERNERLFAEDRRGRPPRETLHILLEGFVKVARHTLAGTGHGKSDERIIAYRQGGDYFAGGLDLLGDGQAVTVTTINRCRVAEVPRQAVLTIFSRYPNVEQRFALKLRDYLEAAAATHSPNTQARARQPFVLASEPADVAAQEGLHELVSDGVVEGTEVLVIDLDKCIHCNECEDACERRHGHSRMNRKGMVVGNISIVTACRQCQDPVCMLCSRAGIARHPNGEVYITESCIGCGICAERCPYGAISIAQVEETEVAQGPWQRLNAWFAKTAGTEQARRTLPMLNAGGTERGPKILPVVSPNVAGGSRAAAGPLDIFPSRSGYDELRKKIAIKCDLCAGYRDQACVQACPTGAALRVQPKRFFGSTEEILRKRVN